MNLSSDGQKLSQKEVEAAEMSAAQIYPRLGSLGYVQSEGFAARSTAKSCMR